MSRHAHTRTVPSGTCYWALLRPESLPRARNGTGSDLGVAREYLDALLAEDLPVSIDDVHAVYVRASDATVIACAIGRDQLHGLKGDALHLTPDALPTFVAGHAIEIDSLNLLVGDFEPVPLARERGHARLIAAAASVALCVLASVGLLRRANSLRQEIAANDSLAVSTARVAIANASSTSGDTARPNDIGVGNALFHMRETLASLRATRSIDPSTSPDAIAPLASLLSEMPHTESLRTDSLSVTPGTISLNLATDHDPQALLANLSAPSGFTMTEPRYTTTTTGTTQLAIQMRRTLPTSPSASPPSTTEGAR